MDVKQIQWLMAIQLVALFCLIRGVDDLRKKRYVWAGLAFIATALLLFTPIQTHAAKIDLPQSMSE
jgi:hypothetical protein